MADPPHPNSGANSLAGVACPGRMRCVAVGSYTQRQAQADAEEPGRVVGRHGLVGRTERQSFRELGRPVRRVVPEHRELHGGRRHPRAAELPQERLRAHGPAVDPAQPRRRARSASLQKPGRGASGGRPSRSLEADRGRRREQVDRVEERVGSGGAQRGVALARGRGRSVVRNTSGVSRRRCGRGARAPRPSDFHTVSVRIRPPRWLVNAPVTSKNQGAPSASAATKLTRHARLRDALVALR